MEVPLGNELGAICRLRPDRDGHHVVRVERQEQVRIDGEIRDQRLLRVAEPRQVTPPELPVKLIYAGYYGNTIPDPAFISSNFEFLETRPFDGLVVYLRDTAVPPFDLTVIDVGWPSTAAIAFGAQVGAFAIPVGLAVNVVSAWLLHHDAAHSLNTLTHFGEKIRVTYDDPDGHDKLYRFAESIQEFFDLAAGLDLAPPKAARRAAGA